MNGNERPLLLACSSRCRLDVGLPASRSLGRLCASPVQKTEWVCLAGEKRGGTTSVGAVSLLLVELASRGRGSGGGGEEDGVCTVSVRSSVRCPACRKQMHRAEARRNETRSRFDDRPRGGFQLLE